MTYTVSTHKEVWIPVTIWHVDTRQSHDIEISHRRHPKNSKVAAEKWAAGDAVEKVILHTSGQVETILKNGRTERIPATDIVIRECIRPEAERGARFIPDTTTKEGRDRIAATFTDPRYNMTEDDYQETNISLAELALIPGAAGTLESLAYKVKSEIKAL